MGLLCHLDIDVCLAAFDETAGHIQLEVTLVLDWFFAMLIFCSEKRILKNCSLCSIDILVHKNSKSMHINFPVFLYSKLSFEERKILEPG